VLFGVGDLNSEVPKSCEGAGSIKKKGQHGRRAILMSKTKTNQRRSSPSLSVAINEYQYKTKKTLVNARGTPKNKPKPMPVTQMMAAMALLNTCCTLARSLRRGNQRPPQPFGIDHTHHRPQNLHRWRNHSQQAAFHISEATLLQ
jgi:hypothetical protein